MVAAASSSQWCSIDMMEMVQLWGHVAWRHAMMEMLQAQERAASDASEQAGLQCWFYLSDLGSCLQRLGEALLR